MNPNIQFFHEPLLEFRYHQKVKDPHNGLSLFGPFDADEPFHPKKVIYSLIGTNEGIEKFSIWANSLNKPIKTEPDLNPLIWPHFPGFETIFDAKWPSLPAWQYVIDKEELEKVAHHADKYQRAFMVVDQYQKGLSLIKKKDEEVDVVICIVPDIIYKNCRPKSYVQNSWGHSFSKKARLQVVRGQKSLNDWLDEKTDNYEWKQEQYQFSVDFRRQLKARAMKYRKPIQIIRESTLPPYGIDTTRELTPPSDIAWNLSTTIYYKSGGKPWKLASARKGVCYIGIAFRKSNILDGNDETACCAAQMFLDTGDGIVFLGDEGPWYSPSDNQFHLNSQSAALSIFLVIW